MRPRGVNVVLPVVKTRIEKNKLCGARIKIVQNELRKFPTQNTIQLCMNGGTFNGNTA